MFRVLVSATFSTNFNYATIISIIGGNLGLWLGVSFAQIWGFLPIAKCFECFFKDKNVVKLK